MSTYFAILTQVGEAKLANAIALGQTLKLKKMGVGDGNGALPIPDRLQKALVHEVRRADLNQLAIDPANASQIIVEQVLPEDVGGWWIREIGIYDEAGDLCAVANCPPSYKPLMVEGSGRTQVVRVVLIVASTAAIELKIDPSVVLATRQYANEQDIEVRAYADKQLAMHLAALDPHPQYKPKELVVVSKSVAGKADVALTAAEAKADVLNVTGALTGGINVIVPDTARSWTIHNQTSGAFTLTMKTAKGAGVPIAQGCRRALYCDGTDVLAATTDAGTATGTTPIAGDVSKKLANTEFCATLAPAGQVAHFATPVAPAGWLRANGAKVSRAAYENLFAAIGTTFGAGDGAATFTLPDLRGEFVRGLDDTRGVDIGRTLGSAQRSTAIRTILDYWPDQSSGAIGAWDTDLAGGVTPQGSNSGTVLNNTAYFKSNNNIALPGTGSNDNQSFTTRPRNVALLACIKY